MTKTIIYLDQSYISNLTKARLGPKVYPRTPPCFRALLRALLAAVEADLVVCPTSPYHFKESALAANGLEQEIYNTLELLCGGVGYLSFPEVLENQVAGAYKRFLGATPDDDSWEVAFDRNPHGARDREFRIERSRGNFNAWTKDVRQYHERVGLLPAVGDYEFSKKFEILQIINTLYVQPFIAFQLGHANIFTMGGHEFLAHRIQDVREVTGRDPEESDIDALVMSFLPSWTENPPAYVDVYASIVAFVVTKHQSRTVQGSDMEDASAAALAVPYCDIFTADRFMKDLLVACGLDQRYGCVVYSPRVADVTALTKEIRRVSRNAKARG